MASNTLNVKGMAEVGRTLKQLPLLVKERIAARSVLEGAKVVKEQVIVLAPYRTGNLRNHIRHARRTKGVGASLVKYVVFVKSGKKKKRSKMKVANRTQSQEHLPYYWYFFEFGTSKMSARPFLVPAFLSKAQEAAERSRDYAKARAARELKKLAKKSSKGAKGA